jgi:hypothetical protein
MNLKDRTFKFLCCLRQNTVTSKKKSNSDLRVSAVPSWIDYKTETICKSRLQQTLARKRVLIWTWIFTQEQVTNNWKNKRKIDLIGIDMFFAESMLPLNRFNLLLTCVLRWYALNRLQPFESDLWLNSICVASTIARNELSKTLKSIWALGSDTNLWPLGSKLKNN